jgi:hypothetical protein
MEEKKKEMREEVENEQRVAVIVRCTYGSSKNIAKGGELCYFPPSLSLLRLSLRVFISSSRDVQRRIYFVQVRKW